MRTILLVALTQVASVCVTEWCGAAPAQQSAAGSNESGPSSQRPLTRQDVELLLREARSAIQQGKLDEAESLVTRAENAHVHYSLFHFGPTPSSVRRELVRAQRKSGTAKSSSPRSKPAGRSPLNPFSSKKAAGAGAVTDPFMSPNRPAGTMAPLPSALGSQPVPPPTPDRESGDAASDAE